MFVLSQVFGGVYEANSRWVISRQVLVPTVATHLALMITTQPPVPFKLQLLQAPTGAEISWTDASDYPIHLEKKAPDGILSIHNTTLPPGKYVANLVLEDSGENGLEGYQPSPIDGMLSSGSGSISWRAVYIPSTDDKVCPIVPDDSQQRYFKAMFESWAAGPVTTAAAAAPPPAKGKGAPAAGGGGPRVQLAAAALEKLEAASAPQDVPADASPPAPTRTLKDGSNLTLEPEARVSVVPASDSAPIILSRDQLEERVASAALALSEAGSAVPQPGPLASDLEQGKSARNALAARRASEFNEWRAQNTAGAKSALRARAVAMLRVQQEQEEAARLAVVTEVSS